MKIENQVLGEAKSYAVKHAGRVASGSNANYPSLHALFRHAKLVSEIRPKAKYFTRQGVEYAIIRHGERICVMHDCSCTVLVGEVEVSDESEKPHP
jgi:hypothetical protein